MDSIGKYFKDLAERADKLRVEKRYKPSAEMKSHNKILLDITLPDLLKLYDEYKLPIKLCHLRTLFFLTIYQVSTETDISTFDYAEYETGLYPPSENEIIRLAELFKVTPEYLSDNNIEIDFTKKPISITPEEEKLWFKGFNLPPECWDNYIGVDIGDNNYIE